MSQPWQPIMLSAKVFGHLSQGLYRTSAGAIKELISNSFDADATLVRIHTGFPRFETFSCEDNGSGMSEDEFVRLMNRGIGSSFKRSNDRTISKILKRPLVGRLGLGILALAQICTQFEIRSHHKESKTAFSATIKFPPYTREEMDKITDKGGSVQGGEYQIETIAYEPSKRGVRIFTKYLRESFRKRMRNIENLANTKILGRKGPYKTFADYLDAIYSKPTITQSLNLASDYDQLIFGLALAAPLPLNDRRNIVVASPKVQARQTMLKRARFRLLVDNLELIHPACLPSDRLGHTASQCKLVSSDKRTFTLTDGSFKEPCEVTHHAIQVKNSDEKYGVYEFRYNKDQVAGSPLKFSGYLFQQTGRLYPRDIQGVLIRISNVAIGKYDNSMLSYPYAEGPRYSMVSNEVFVESGFEDALNIDRDSFNELHPHYIRVQSYVHSLLHELIFPESWGEEKKRNKTRREAAEILKSGRFSQTYSSLTGEAVKKIVPVERAKTNRATLQKTDSAVTYGRVSGQIEIDRSHPLLQKILKRKKYAAVAERIVVAFERANSERTAEKRRELFYSLLTEILSDI